MAKFRKTEDNEKIVYALDDSSLPEGCTHPGANTISIWKVTGYRIEQQACACLAYGQSWDGTLRAAVESENEIVSA